MSIEIEVATVARWSCPRCEKSFSRTIYMTPMDDRLGTIRENIARAKLAIETESKMHLRDFHEPAPACHCSDPRQGHAPSCPYSVFARGPRP